ncbi:MAG: hypothetical protein IKE38_03585 [Erysipelotrichaceae bacterium]|nr:hypothetical protein [Erysipelotrichaceae bacterium]
MKKGIVLLVIMMAFSLFGCSSLKITGGDKGLDLVDARIVKASADKNKNTGSTVIETKVELTGNSDIGLMSIHGLYHFLNGNGEEIDAVPFFYLNVEDPLEKGETVTTDYSFQKKFAEDVKQIYLEITEVKNTEELPPKHLPESGEYLYASLNSERLANIKTDLPVKIMYINDQSGFRTYYTVEGPEKIEEAVALFTSIKISKETDEVYTDCYNGIAFSWPDGSGSYVSINRNNLEMNIYNQYHYYELEGLAGFINGMAEMGTKTTD